MLDQHGLSELQVPLGSQFLSVVLPKFVLGQVQHMCLIYVVSMTNFH
jgi:hypothetical protein